MKLLALLICVLVSLKSLVVEAQSPQNAANSNSTTTKYLSLVIPTLYKGDFLNFNNANVAVVVNDINTLPHDNTLIKLFPNTQSSITMFTQDNSGNLSVLGNTLAAEKGTYRVIYEFSEFQPRSQAKDDAGNYTTLCVGISVRLVATINTTKANIDLSKIIALVGLSASSSKVSGQLEISIKGINSPTLTSLNPIPNGAMLTTDNIITALQAIAAIKSHFSDKDVAITPEVLGFYQSTTSLPAENQTYQKTVQKIQQQMQ